MSFKKLIGLAVLIGGVVLLVASYSIKGQVSEGRSEISSAQQNVDTSKKLFSSNPVSKEVGNVLTGQAQNKINAGSAEANYYENLAQQFQIGGYVLIALGIGLIVFLRKK